MKITISVMLSLIVALLLVPFSSAMASTCDYDLREGAVYVNENRVKRDAGGNSQQNRLIVFSRGADGLLTEVQRVESGGFGNDASIITSGQFSVIVSYKHVLMINAGFDPNSGSRAGSVSAFKVGKCRVTLTDVKSTVGQEPRSVTRNIRVFGDGSSIDRVAVVNDGSGTVQFFGCPGLPPVFVAPTGITCGPQNPVTDFERTSYTIYSFNKRQGTFKRLENRKTRDRHGDSAQISYMNEGRQLLISQRNTFFALGDGTEDDIMEVVKLNQKGRTKADASGFTGPLAQMLGYRLPGEGGLFNVNDIAPRFTNPVVSLTTGNDNFGFEPIHNPGRNFDDCVVLTHGSFQQRQQGGTSQVTITKFGALRTVQPNKPDGQDDTCWTAFSRGTNTLYASAFFNSGISMRSLNPLTCVMSDGGPPLDLSGAPGVVTFAPPPGNGLTHRMSSHPARDGVGSLLRDDSDVAAETSFPGNQSDFLYEAGGLDMGITQGDGSGAEYLYVMNARVPFSIGQNSSGDWLYPPDTTDLAIYTVVQEGECTDTLTIFGADCRPGDLVFTGRSTTVPGSAFGVAVY